MKEQVAAKLFIAILILLSIFQLALIFGAPLGHFAWGGQHEHLTSQLKIGSGFALLIYFVFGMIISDRSGIKKFFNHPRTSIYGTWFIVGYSFLGIIMNAASRSRAERYTLTPIVFLMFVLALIVALKPKN